MGNAVRAEWLVALDTDHQNLRAALEFSRPAQQEVAVGAELACDLWPYWLTHGHITEGRRILASLLDELEQTAARPTTGQQAAGATGVAIPGSRYQFVMYPMYFAVPARLLMTVVVLALCHWTFCSLQAQDEVALHMREPR